MTFKKGFAVSFELGAGAEISHTIDVYISEDEGFNRQILDVPALVKRVENRSNGAAVNGVVGAGHNEERRF